MKLFDTKIIFLICSLILQVEAYAQTNQVRVGRIDQMPDLPSPFLMRDWKSVAEKYDDLIFSTDLSGEHLPLVRFGETGFNYPAINHILLDTYVGSYTSGSQGEAINIMPAIVGASLVGTDKTNHKGLDWVTKTKDFFNKRNGENVYLNNYNAFSGHDWWYDLMPNIFFYQLYSLYPDIPDFQEHFLSVADQWLRAVHQMGGSTTPYTVPFMNYRGWYLSSMTPNAQGVKEPESAGAIAWLLYHAYIKTGQQKYLQGAQMSLDYLLSLSSNPSYELQLPYGAFIAAKLNAEEGTTYDLEKLVNWCFDRGPLRGWGSIIGSWNGADVSGLIGEANDRGNDYAFIMNGFQQVAALVPMVKYDKRFAHAIAKWTLNVANASRLFYPKYLPSADQDDFTWSNQHDPESVIAYEALKEVWEGKQLYGTGDAKRGGWAETNLCLYGSSHVGYMASVLFPTNVEGIVLLDVNKTDFFGKNVFPSYLTYNPFSQSQSVQLNVGTENVNIYDAISESILKEDVNGEVEINLEPNQVVLLVYVPSNAERVEKEGKLWVEDEIIDYHFGYDFQGRVRIKSFDVKEDIVEYGNEIEVFCTLENVTEGIGYAWYVNGTLQSTDASDIFAWQAPSEEGTYIITLELIKEGEPVATQSLEILVVERIPKAPVIEALEFDKEWYFVNETATVNCLLESEDENYQYQWEISGGEIIKEEEGSLTWKLSSEDNYYSIKCKVTNLDALETVVETKVLVKKNSLQNVNPIAYYPFDGDVNDYSGNGYHATKKSVVPTQDARGWNNLAYRFASGEDLIAVENQSPLNFSDKVTISFWLKLDRVNHESFVVSHGSWQDRYKISVVPDRKLRWTVKTSAGVVDLDSSFPLDLGRFYHCTAVYTGYSMELYIDGQMDSFAPHHGTLPSTSKHLTFGKQDQSDFEYYLQGSLDEVRIYNEKLMPKDIELLKDLWHTVTSVQRNNSEEVIIYPNPTTHQVYVKGDIESLRITNITGQVVQYKEQYLQKDLIKVELPDYFNGLLIVQIKTKEKTMVNKVLVIK